MQLYNPTYLYQHGTCGYAGGTEYSTCGLSVGVGFGGQVWRGFCLCGWRGAYWRDIKRHITDEVMAHARYYTWGALAYSTSTSNFSGNWGKGSLEIAKRDALMGCRASDAQILTWGYDRFVVAAKSSNGHIGYANSLNRDAAERGALEECQYYGGDCRIVLIINTAIGKIYG